MDALSSITSDASSGGGDGGGGGRDGKTASIVIVDSSPPAPAAKRPAEASAASGSSPNKRQRIEPESLSSSSDSGAAPATATATATAVRVEGEETYTICPVCKERVEFSEIDTHAEAHFPVDLTDEKSPAKSPLKADRKSLAHARSAADAMFDYDSASGGGGGGSGGGAATSGSGGSGGGGGGTSAGPKPVVWKLSSDQQMVVNAIRSGVSVFFTGSAGTGKSYLLQYLKENVFRDAGTFITASTGLAAVNIGGTTLHSWAGIGLGKMTAEAHANSILKINGLARRWHRATRLVIDEISMIGGQLFDLSEEIARIVRDSDLPFGGLQLVISGDFLQLPPVKQDTFAFEAKSWNRCIQHENHYQLMTVFRQTDREFVHVLQQLRVGICSGECLFLACSYVVFPRFDFITISHVML